MAVQLISYIPISSLEKLIREGEGCFSQKFLRAQRILESHPALHRVYGYNLRGIIQALEAGKWNLAAKQSYKALLGMTFTVFKSKNLPFPRLSVLDSYTDHMPKLLPSVKKWRTALKRLCHGPTPTRENFQSAVEPLIEGYTELAGYLLVFLRNRASSLVCSPTNSIEEGRVQLYRFSQFEKGYTLKRVTSTQLRARYVSSPASLPGLEFFWQSSEGISLLCGREQLLQLCL